MASTDDKKVTLLSSDGEAFVVGVDVVMQSQTLKHMVEDSCVDNGIPLPNVTGKSLSKVFEYCNKHAGVDKYDPVNEELKSWDSDFVVNLDQPTLFDLIEASNYLDIKNLLDLTCKRVADMIRGKTPEEIRETFHIKNDYTPEEEEEVRRENEWAFE